MTMLVLKTMVPGRDRRLNRHPAPHRVAVQRFSAFLGPAVIPSLSGEGNPNSLAQNHPGDLSEGGNWKVKAL